MNPFKIFLKKNKSDKKQLKELKKYPCDCYLSNALYFIETGEIDVAYKEICYAILRSGGKLSDSQLKKFNELRNKRGVTCRDL